MKFSGKCLCGAIGYDADGPPVVVAQCHCEECRRLSGTGHSIGAMFPAKAVRIHGDLHEYRYTSAKGSKVTKASCATCGSPIYGTNTRSPDYLTLTLGSMDEAAGLEVQVVVFERDKPHWDQLPEDTVCFETQPDWQPDT
ncbi:GFA family protein [Roseibium sp. Sym1]|uniref:GFA family protein n=1 Tax=Roseibium sp. Sym1 TaxID=3016006 RepID=UPI003FA6C4AD